jgi:tetratricopeptide (TPR) repeat protein
MDFNDFKFMMDTARDYFLVGEYKKAEPILHQALLKNNRDPELFYLLGCVYHDQGKFTKAIKTLKRALELDPTYSDASVSLSIILNDLGKYEEGREVFENAQRALNDIQRKSDPLIEAKLVSKHIELADLYSQCKRYPEAIDQLYRALPFSARKQDLLMRVVDCFVRAGDQRNAIRELKNVVRDFPSFLPARIRLGVVLFNDGQVAEAVEHWENVLVRDPENTEVKRLIQVAQSRQETSLARPTTPGVSLQK